MVKKILFLVTGMVFVFHFTWTALYNLPLNPVKLKYSSVISGYIEPLFTQNWRLFAPDPVTEKNRIYVRLKLKEESGKIRKTGWIDLTTFMIEKNQKNRFTPYNRLVRIQRGAVTAMTRKNDIVYELKDKVKEKKLDEKKYKDIIQSDSDDLRVKLGKKMLNRYAQAYAKSLYPTATIEESQVLIKRISSVPYSKRNKSDYTPKETVTNLEWTPYQSDVAPIF
ncbi:DUF5819 family protein [Melghirimyces algeriensis]|uniref:Uncharacterized protein n=1 Tax=Melghirimyces algeriensis TaxID=910412 RepID=A0A521DZK1_9BACL|nr:DUF5819 family protein [Melghirimyces algeriensis]SMO77153.1 hypothetical protein SAMN06264849_10775 [Melghirimyces algeriensis]